MSEKILYIFLLLISSSSALLAQNERRDDAFLIKDIYDEALSKGEAYDWLRVLTKDVGPRLAGSPGAAAAVTYMRQIIDTLGFDTVYLQPCIAPRWERGEPAVGRIVNNDLIGSQDIRVVALGNSVGTGEAGVTAEIIEVTSLDTLEQLGPEVLSGKIVFFNRPMDPRQLNTFAAYSGAVDQRVFGANEAGKYGAVAALVRSMTPGLDDVPHTGTMAYSEGARRIPGLALSTNDADKLSALLKKGSVRVHLKSQCRNLPPVETYNVIAEVTGSTYPDEIILVGGHLDSWDIGEGAHDDGSGCVQSMQVWPLLQALDYRPQRTLRCVLFMNEENGLAGGRAYWDASNTAGEFHLMAMESDRGGFSPRGFTAEATEEVFADYMRKLTTWLPLVEPYGLSFSSGGSGADIGGLKSQGGLLMGLQPDTQRYFDYHHTSADRLEAVNQRELLLGAAAMTSLVYLIDKYGLR
ncbi:MAG: M28 family peptidase [Bacteroidota bacterium]